MTNNDTPIFARLKSLEDAPVYAETVRDEPPAPLYVQAIGNATAEAVHIGATTDKAVTQAYYQGRTEGYRDGLFDGEPVDKILPSEARKGLSWMLFTLSLLAGIASIVVMNFPELNVGDNLVPRLISTVNAAVSLISGAFGIVIVIPNINTPGKVK